MSNYTVKQLARLSGVSVRLEHPYFRANFDRNGAGFTDCLAAAMKANATHLAA